LSWGPCAVFLFKQCRPDVRQSRVPEKIDDLNVPALPKAEEESGVNEWLPGEKERQAFKVDPRFEVNLFAGEEQFPEIANPIQIRWDSRGRLWVSCSNAYPHVYPGNEPNDKIVILEDTDGDGKAAVRLRTRQSLSKFQRAMRSAFRSMSAGRAAASTSASGFTSS
jgi:hypothetical protein